MNLDSNILLLIALISFGLTWGILYLIYDIIRPKYKEYMDLRLMHKNYRCINCNAQVIVRGLESCDFCNFKGKNNDGKFYSNNHKGESLPNNI